METIQQNGRFTLFFVNSTLIYILFSLIITYKGNVRVISSNSLLYWGLTQIYNGILKALYDQVHIIYQWFCFLKFLFSFAVSLLKKAMEKLTEINIFWVRQTTVSSTTLNSLKFEDEHCHVCKKVHLKISFQYFVPPC